MSFLSSASGKICYEDFPFPPASKVGTKTKRAKGKIPSRRKENQVNTRKRKRVVKRVKKVVTKVNLVEVNLEEVKQVKQVTKSTGNSDKETQ